MLILIFLFILSTIVSAQEVPKATTPLGEVIGSYKTSADGRTFAAFEGIPYAKPPIGDLRFAEPQPIQKWKGTWKANTLVTCIQVGLFDELTKGSEDCLYINVYVPRKEITPSDNFEVIAHIHGGGFVSGSGHEFCGPEYLMDRDIVYVTFNYRLNLFGFLSLADEVLPGNNGLKDQTLALKWIQENIASFGGNPKSVTLTGVSAGAASVHYHYLSPLSRGLFHRGLSQSGTALNSWALQDKPIQYARRLASLAGCPDFDSKVIVNCLRERNAQFLAEKIKEFSLIDGMSFGPIITFAPVIEKGMTNAFLPDHPYTLLKQNKVLDVPWITSVTADEGVLITLITSPHLPIINEKWDKLAAILLDYNFTAITSKLPKIAQSIKKHYIGDGDISFENLDKYTKMFSQRYFVIDAEKSAKLQSRANKSPVYFYYFGYRGSMSFTDLIPHHSLKGISHGDDGLYMYYFSQLPTANLKLNPEDTKMKNAFLDMIVSYAKTNVPAFKDEKPWEPTEGSEFRFLKIKGPMDMQMTVDKQFSDNDFWSKLGLLENDNLFTNIKDEL